jgi:hypothetical protein
LGETPTFTKSPQNPTHNPLGRGRVLGIEKNTLKFGEKWGLVGIKLVQNSSTKHIFRSEWGFGVWWGLSPQISTKTLVPNKALGNSTVCREKIKRDAPGEKLG